MASVAVVSLTQTPALISIADSGAVAGQSVAFTNETGVNIRVGGSDVSTSAGCLVLPNAPFSMPLDTGEALYAVCASGTHDQPVMHGGV